MNEKGIGIIIVVLLVVAFGVSTYLLLNKDTKKENANTNSTSNETSSINEASNNENNSNVENNDNNTTSKGKVLVVYFSVPETNDPNKKMTAEEENSAIVVDGKVLGNTQYVAQLISEYTGADIYRIEPRTPYPTNHEELVALAKDEQNKNVRPEIKSRIVDFDDYDIVYVGYPIWWSDMPQILYTFFELYDFNGKTVIPFSTHGGSGLAGTVTKIKEKLSGATVKKMSLQCLEM